MGFLADREKERAEALPVLLLEEGRRALEAVLAAGRHARQAGTPGARRRLVVKPDGDGGLLPDILAVYEQVPDLPGMEVVFGDHADRAALLRDGRADVGLLHTPHEDLRGLDAETLMVEPRVAVLPDRHRLARRASLRWADLRGETLPRWHGRATDGATGPEVTDITQLKQLIVRGRAIVNLRGPHWDRWAANWPACPSWMLPQRPRCRPEAGLVGPGRGPVTSLAAATSGPQRGFRRCGLRAGIDRSD